MAFRTRLALILLALTLHGCQFSARVFTNPFGYVPIGHHRRVAEQLKTEGKFEEAIVAYQKHIEARYADKGRPEQENPSFYYIMIGDLELKLERPEDALRSYLRAREDGVMPEFTIDRVRQVSAYYERRGQLQTAIELLKVYRELDPLLFDWDIDRIHKATVRGEQAENGA